MINPQIKATGLELTDAIRDYALQKLGDLKEHADRITHMSIELGHTTEHHKHGDIFRAEINVTVPGKLIRAEKTADNLYAAIDKVKDTIKMELKKYKEKQTARSRSKLRKFWSRLRNKSESEEM